MRRKTVRYKVWIEIESIDETNNRYEPAGLPEPLGEFERLDQAERRVIEVLERFNPDALDTSDLTRKESR